MHVTVLMSVYNEEANVVKAIRSVQCQSYSNWDLLIVDDSSTDDTPRLLAQLQRTDRRIGVLRNKTNIGLAASLNRGWRNAKSELIARLDGDDECFPERLRMQVEFMQQHREVDVLGSGIEMVTESGDSVGISLRPETHEELVQKIYQENPVFHPTIMVRRSFYETSGGYDERLRRAQDCDLWLRSYRRFRFQNLRCPLVRFRVKRKPSWDSVLYGSYVVARAAYREKGILRGTPYPLRFFTAGLLTKLGVIWTRPR